MAETVEKLTTGETLTIDQLIGYLPALKEIPRAQLENWASRSPSFSERRDRLRRRRIRFDGVLRRLWDG